MGQQQLLLIVLGVIVVGIAIAVGVTMFQSNAIESNRQAVISDLVNYASKAQRFYRTPAQLGGGSQSFDDFYISPIDTGNANGSYSAGTTAPSGTAFVAGSTTAISSSSGTIYLTGCGKEIGDNGSTVVKVAVTVTPSDISTTILN